MATKTVKKSSETKPSVRDKVRLLERDMNRVLLEREQEVRSAILALLCGQHVFQLGVPGVGKSLLATELVRRLQGCSKYEILLSRFSTPEEVFGPPSLKALKEHDRYERNGQGMLQGAEIAFLDEIWKANSAILNTLLPILNERLYREGGVTHPVPLVTMICASNELPQGDDLGALYDRILFRHVVRPLTDHGMRRLLLDPPEDKIEAILTKDELEAAQIEVQGVNVTSNTVDAMLALRLSLSKKKGVQVSPRRWKVALGAIQARAWLAGRTETQVEDLLVLTHCLWNDPENANAVESAVIDIAAPSLREVRELLDLAEEMQLKWAQATDENVRVEALTKLKGLVSRVKSSALNAGEEGKRIVKKIENMHREVIREEKRVQAERLGFSDLLEDVE